MAMAVLQSSFTYLLDGTEIYYCVLRMSGYNGCVKLLKPRGHCTYSQFNIQQFYVLSTPCIYEFSVDHRTNSNYFPIQD